MKKNLSKILTLLTLVSCLTISSISLLKAEETNNSEKTNVESIEEISEEKKANEESIEKVASTETKEILFNLVDIENQKYFKVREVAEALGYTVEWDSETKSVTISNLPVYVKFFIGIDGYTFARTAPMRLGASPIILEDSTYVPTAILELIADGSEIKLTDKTLTVIKTELTESKESKDEASNKESKISSDALSLVEILEINAKDKTLLVKDATLGDVVLNLTNENIAEDILSSLKVGQSINVLYSEEMTLSLPPINTPLKVTLSI